MANQPNDYIINLEKDKRAEFSTVLKLEEEFWAMKARISRLVEGHKNTAFLSYFSACPTKKESHHSNEKLNGELDPWRF